MNKNLTFEGAFARLEEIANVLESGDPDLEQIMALFEEANTLSSFCTEKIEAAEEKLKILTKDAEFKLKVEES